MLRRIEDAKRMGCQGIEFDNPDVSMSVTTNAVRPA
jgi:hypothetical protein